MEYKATKNGLVPFTAAEKAEWDAKQVEYESTAHDRKAAEVLMAINNLFNMEVKGLTAGVVQGEIDTFATQEKEAEAYMADNNANVPLLSGLAAVRQITVADLAGRVLAHAAAYKAAMGAIMGKKHKLEDQVTGAKTIEDLKKIEVI